MSVNININKMSCTGRSYAERAEEEKRKINRLLSVREQSNVLSQKVLNKTRTAKEQELKKIQQLKEKELCEWKKRAQCNIQNKIDNCIENFGDAHIAAINASCEEDEPLREKRDEQDLMAAMRGRVAMLKIQRDREREIESKLLKKKRLQQKTVGIQADFLTQRTFSENIINNNKRHVEAIVLDEDEGEEEINEIYSTKPNFHKHSEPYNPQNYTSHSVDSSNHNDDTDNDEIVELDEDSISDQLEFNQISNLLKHRLQKNDYECQQEIAEIQSSDSESTSPVEVPKKVTIVRQSSPKKKKKGILKKSPAKKASPVKSSRKSVPVSQERVRYVDFGNKYETSYIPDKNLIVRSEKSKTNAKQNAQMQTDDDLLTKKINDDILKQLTDLRSQEALEKEKIRRDYDSLRFELDELGKQEQEAKAKSNMYKNLSRDKLMRNEEARQRKMNEAAENAMKRNIITCPPVDIREKSTKPKSNEINVAAPYYNNADKKSTSVNLTTRSNSEVNNLIKIEKLKDLLEKINHQKRLLLNEIEKSEDIPGPDLQKVVNCLEKLENEKAALNPDNKIDESKLKKIDELDEREKKIKERELRLESRLRELFKKQKENVLKSSSSSSTDQIQSSDSSSSAGENTKKTVQTPVEIIIKVQQPKSPYKKSKKLKCIDTLSKQPGKVYPKTPIKKKKSSSEEVVEVEAEKSQQQTQTSPISLDNPRPILKSSTLKQISIPPVPKVASSSVPKVASSSLLKESSSLLSKQTSNSSVSQQFEAPPIPQQKKRQDQQSIEQEDFSCSTVYRELPPQINLVQKETQKTQRKLNPLLMDYITRLLGMNKNIGNQLNVNVSSVTTPGSSTINTSENVSSSVNDIIFDNDRMNRLQKFIDDNHSFMSEINESLEKVENQKRHDENIEKVVEGIWRDILRQKSHSRTSDEVKKVPSSMQTTATKSSNKPNLPQKDPKYSKLSNTTSRSQLLPETSRSQKAQQPKITQEDMTNVTKYIDSQMLNNYTEYTANCQRRITELTQMMEKVRQEKLKLIENSLSSNEFNNFTEYKEIAAVNSNKNDNNNNTNDKNNNKNNVQTASSDPKDSPPSNRLDDPPSEEINNILQFQTRPFGVSKDSGISGISRPVTSSDFRDSPDVRVTSEENNNNNNNNLFQPILKDIPKVPRMKLTSTDGDTHTIKDISQVIRQQQEEKAQKKPQRPPLSLKSPQFEKQHEAHELSTIAEIETPTASKVNLMPDEVSGVGALHSFPNYEEYAKENDLTVGNETRQISFPDLGDLKQALPDIKVKTFVGDDNLTLGDLSKDDFGIGSNTGNVYGSGNNYKQSVTTFGPQENIYGQLVNTSAQQQQNDDENSSNASSLMDIQEELKRRHLIEKSFHIYVEDEGRDDLVGDACEKDEKTTPTATKQVIVMPLSPKRKPAQSRIIIKTTPEHTDKTIESIIKTPTKRKQPVGSNLQKHVDVLESPTKSNDTLSGIQEIERDFQVQGLGWAASTLKRTEESSNKKQDSSPSSNELRPPSFNINLQFEDSSSSSDGRPLNLRDFLRRELLSRSKNDKYLSDDSSLSSKFMKSLLRESGADGSATTSSSNDPKSESSQNVKLRTSTPVRMSSENLVKTGASSQQMFVGAESMSTVRDSDSSCKEKSKSL